MSYILDALRKAEAERNVGTAPGAELPRSFQHPPSSRGASNPWPWVALAAVAVAGVLGGLAWLRPAAVVPPAAAPIPAVAAAAAPAATDAQAEAQAEAQADTQAQLSVAADAMSAEAEETVEALPAAQAGAAFHEAEEDKPVASRPPKKTPPKKPNPAAITALRDLPASIQQQVPPVSIGGYIYSDNKADRSVLINNRLRREGEDVAPGLTLERMTPTGVVLAYKGYRFHTKY